MKKIFLAVSLFVAGLMLPLSASALCGQGGQVVRTYDSATQTYAYLQTAPLSSIYYYTITSDLDLRNALRACKVSGERCWIYGNASSCPTTGTGRYMGTTSSVYHNP